MPNWHEKMVLCYLKTQNLRKKLQNSQHTKLLDQIM